MFVHFLCMCKHADEHQHMFSDSGETYFVVSPVSWLRLCSQVMTPLFPSRKWHSPTKPALPFPMLAIPDLPQQTLTHPPLNTHTHTHTHTQINELIVLYQASVHIVPHVRLFRPLTPFLLSRMSVRVSTSAVVNTSTLSWAGQVLITIPSLKFPMKTLPDISQSGFTRPYQPGLYCIRTVTGEPVWEEWRGER